MKYISENIQINILIKDKGKLIANANLSILTIDYGFITIKNFQIWDSTKFNERLQEAINITPPSRPAYGKYHKIAFFEHDKKWFEIEGLIYNKYLEKRKSTKNYSESINLEDIDLNATNSQE